MKVTITRDGVYADFESVPGKCGATERKQGDKVDYPRWYALDLIASGLARETVEVVEMTAPEVIPFSEPVLSPTVEWDEPTPSEPAAYDARNPDPSDPDMTQFIQPEPNATDKARAIAATYSVDLGSVEGTGKDGRITAADVRKAIK